MFFQTQLKTIGAGGAVDMQGRRLAFIGYLPVNAGDWVFTDGTVIFGNSKPKGAPAVFKEQQSGIPVIADDLRGYFTSRGQYKPYIIAGDTWLVNDKKKYAHDSDASNIIDAEVADDGGVYTVEKTIVEYAPAEPDDGVLFYRYYSYEPKFNVLGHQQKYFSTINFDLNSLVANTKKEIAFKWLGDFVSEYVKRDTVIKQPVLIIRKDGEEVQTVPMQTLVAPAEEFALSRARVPLDFPEHHIKSRAQLLNFKILPNGSWTALIIAEVGAERDIRDEDNGKLEMATVAAHLIALDKISSNGNCEKITQYLMHFPFYRVTDVKRGFVSHDPNFSAPFDVDRTTFPYDDWDWTSFEASVGGLVEVTYATGVVWDSHFMTNAPDYDNAYLNYADYFSFPVQDGYEAELKNYTGDAWQYPRSPKPFLRCYYDFWEIEKITGKDGKQVLDNLSLTKDFHKADMSIVPLKNGKFLFGIRKDEEHEIDGALYKVDRDGTVEQVGNGLKNFRLRELKKISKSKT